MERRGFFAALAAAVVAPFAAKAVEANPEPKDPCPFSHRPDEPCNCTWYTGEPAGPSYHYDHIGGGEYRVTRCDGKVVSEDDPDFGTWGCE